MSRCISLLRMMLSIVVVLANPTYAEDSPELSGQSFITTTNTSNCEANDEDEDSSNENESLRPKSSWDTNGRHSNGNSNIENNNNRRVDNSHLHSPFDVENNNRHNSSSSADSCVSEDKFPSSLRPADEIGFESHPHFNKGGDLKPLHIHRPQQRLAPSRIDRQQDTALVGRPCSTVQGEWEMLYDSRMSEDACTAPTTLDFKDQTPPLKVKGVTANKDIHHAGEKEKMKSFHQTIESENMGKVKRHDEIEEFIREMVRKDIDIGVKNIEFFDAAVVYDKSDYEHVKRFVDEVKEIVEIAIGEPIRIELFDSIAFAQSKVMVVEDVIERCSVVFVYLTENCTEETVKLFCEEGIGITRLQLGSSENPWAHDRAWVLKPVHTQPQKRRRYKTPIGLVSLHGVDWYDKDSSHTKDKLIHIMKEAQTQRKRRESVTNTNLNFKRIEKERLQPSKPSMKPETKFLKAAYSYNNRQSIVEDAESFPSTHTRNGGLYDNQIPYQNKLVPTGMPGYYPVPGIHRMNISGDQQNLPIHLNSYTPYGPTHFPGYQYPGQCVRPSPQIVPAPPPTIDPYFLTMRHGTPQALQSLYGMYEQRRQAPNPYQVRHSNGAFQMPNRSYTQEARPMLQIDPQQYAQQQRQQQQYVQQQQQQQQQFSTEQGTNKMHNYSRYTQHTLQINPQQQHLQQQQQPYISGQMLSQDQPQSIREESSSATSGLGNYLRDQKNDAPATADLSVVSRVTGQLIVNPNLSTDDIEIDNPSGREEDTFTMKTSRHSRSSFKQRDMNEISDTSSDDSDFELPVMKKKSKRSKGKVLNFYGCENIQLGAECKVVKVQKVKSTKNRKSSSKQSPVSDRNEASSTLMNSLKQSDEHTQELVRGEDAVSAQSTVYRDSLDMPYYDQDDIATSPHEDAFTHKSNSEQVFLGESRCDLYQRRQNKRSEDVKDPMHNDFQELSIVDQNNLSFKLESQAENTKQFVQDNSRDENSFSDNISDDELFAESDIHRNILVDESQSPEENASEKEHNNDETKVYNQEAGFLFSNFRGIQQQMLKYSFYADSSILNGNLCTNYSVD